MVLYSEMDQDVKTPMEISCTADVPRSRLADPSLVVRRNLDSFGATGEGMHACSWLHACRHVSGFGFACPDGPPASVQPTVSGAIPSFCEL